MNALIFSIDRTNRFLMHFCLGMTLLMLSLPGAPMLAQTDAQSYDGPPVLPTDITFGLECFHLDYKEELTAPMKSTEAGLIPGFHISTTTNRHYPLYFAVGLAYAAATETYDGSTQLGAPVTSDTKSSFMRIGVTTNYRSELGGSWTLTPHIGYQYREWDRNIQGSGGIRELYMWHTLPVGFLLNSRVSPTVTMGLDLEASIMVHGTMRIYFSGDNVVLTLGNRFGFRITAPVCIGLSDNWSLCLSPYYEWYGYGKSNPYREYDRDLFLEPESTTKLIGITAGFIARL